MIYKEKSLVVCYFKENIMETESQREFFMVFIVGLSKYHTALVLAEFWLALEQSHEH